MIGVVFALLTSCGPKEPPQSAPSTVAVELRLAPATDGVTVECVVRLVQPPAVTVRMVVHNGTDHGIVLSNASTPMHVVHRTSPSDELRVFHGPTANPSSEEVHLMLRDPSKFETVPAGATAEFRGGFSMRPSATGAFFEPGDSADGFLPLGCAVSYWDEAEWLPEPIEGGRFALSNTMEFRGVTGDVP